MMRSKLLSLAPLAAASLLATPALAQHAHGGDLLLGSTVPGSGRLLVDFDFGGTPDVVVSEFFDFGNGSKLFTSTDPGFDALGEDEPDEGIFELANGATIGVRLVSVDPGVAMQLNGVLLDAPGETVTVGTYQGGEELHVHPTYRLTAPGDDAGVHSLTFQLFQSGGGATYADSVPYTLELSTVVPEPATLAALAGAGVLALQRRRR